MKPDSLTLTSSSHQRATEFAEDLDSILPASKRRAVANAHGETHGNNEGDQSKSLRLPSIKHLQLDFGTSWGPTLDQVISSPRQSPQLSSSSSSSSTSPAPTVPSASPGTFSSSPAFPSSPALMSPPSTPSLLRNSPAATKPLRTITTRTPSTTTTTPLLSLSTSSVTSPYTTPPSSSPTTLSSSAPAAMASMVASYQIPHPQATNPSSLSGHNTSQEVLVPVVTNNFGFIETTFANVPMKKTHRRRPANVDKTSLYCHNCGSKNTPEWRRGPGGPATLCNACGLAYAKRLRQEEDSQQLHTTLDNNVTTSTAQYGYNDWCPTQLPIPQMITQTHSRPMQLVKGMPIRINSHTFHNYTPPTPHPSIQQIPGHPLVNQVFY